MIELLEVEKFALCNTYGVLLPILVYSVFNGIEISNKTWTSYTMLDIFFSSGQLIKIGHSFIFHVRNSDKIVTNFKSNLRVMKISSAIHIFNPKICLIETVLKTNIETLTTALLAESFL